MNGCVSASGKATAVLKRAVKGLWYGPVHIRTRLLLEVKVRDLPRVTPVIPLRYRFGDANDLERLRAVDPRFDESVQRAAEQELARGDRLILGEYQGQVVFYVWIVLGEPYDEDVAVEQLTLLYCRALGLPTLALRS